MGATQDNAVSDVGKRTPPESDPTKVDRNAPAGSEDSLGAESVLGVVEAERLQGFVALCLKMTGCR